MSKSEGSTPDEVPGLAKLRVENIGGINRNQLQLEPGVTVLSGRNATNRTSCLSAIGAVLGGSTASLKSDAERGKITLEMGDETYSKSYIQTPDGVRTEGATYLGDGKYVDLFVSLLDDNPARRAVERGDDLREIIMRPVDTAAIDDRISTLQTEISELDRELEMVEQRRNKLPDLVDRRNSLNEKIAQLDEQLAGLRNEASSIEEEWENVDESSDLVDELDALRSKRVEVRNELEVNRAERDALRNEITELEEESASLPDVSIEDIDVIEQELEVARERKSAIDETITSLNTILEFNDRILNGNQTASIIDADEDDVTAALDPNSSPEIDCWTCGSRVERDRIESRLDDLRGLVSQKRDEQRVLSKEIEQLNDDLAEHQDAIEKRETITQRLEKVREKIADREDQIQRLENEAEELAEEIQDFEADLADSMELQESDLSETYEQISDAEFERGRLRKELDDVEAEIAEIESLPQVADLKARRDEYRDELQDMRDRIDALENSAVEAFNDHMNELIGILDYQNLARIWIERKHKQAGQSTEFQLHIVRETTDSSGYEDVVTHLSESEREVIGLVVALSGYLVHEVYEDVPFMLLDSLEAIDGERISGLIEYFSQFVPFLVVALLPSDAASLHESNQTVVTESFG